jgi:hypothetical protein
MNRIHDYKVKVTGGRTSYHLRFEGAVPKVFIGMKQQRLNHSLLSVGG